MLQRVAATSFISVVRSRRFIAVVATSVLAMLLASSGALAHGVTAGDKGYIQEVSGPNLIQIGRASCRERV